jgi:hypothetical protein
MAKSVQIIAEIKIISQAIVIKIAIILIVVHVVAIVTSAMVKKMLVALGAKTNLKIIIASQIVIAKVIMDVGL